MATEEVKMKSIWYVVGMMLLVMGGMVFISGIHNLLVPPAHKTVLSELHPEIWWGGLIFVFGGVLFFSHRK
jgi:hypothetical protein